LDRERARRPYKTENATAGAAVILSTLFWIKKLVFIGKFLSYHTNVWYENFMNLSMLSDKALLENLNNLARSEREILIKILHHLREVEKRHLYAKLSYSSLFEYAVKELKYSESAAQRRISSMRLLREIPEIEAKVESGALNLSALSQAQSFFRLEKENIKSVQEKVEILQVLENKTLQQVQRELLKRSSNPASLMPERVKPVSETHSEIKFLAEEALLKDLEELRNLLSHSKPNASIKDLVLFAVSRTVNELRPKTPKAKGLQTTKENTSQKGKRYIKQEVRRWVWQRDLGQCTFSDPLSGRKCCSKNKLEFDHVIPFGMGGDNSAANLRLRCRAHNQLAAIEAYGQKKIARYIRRMRSEDSPRYTGIVTAAAVVKER
jgi:hypothetical protein